MKLFLFGQTERNGKQRTDYIHNNPVRTGIVEHAEEQRKILL